MKEKNSLLELWRFLFCMAVLGLHFFAKTDLNYFHAGYLGVEFFFIVAGYFVGAYYNKYQKDKDLKVRFKSVGNYAVSRFKRLYPFYLLALIIILLVRTVLKQYQLREIWSVIKSCFAEFFLLQWTVLGNEVLISAGWFVPAVFFGGIFFVLLLAFTGKIGGFVFAPVISFFIYRYYFLLIGKIDVIFSYHSVLRGIAGIGFGVFIYFLCNEIKGNAVLGKRENKWISGILCMISSVLFLAVFIYTNYGRRSKLDFLVILLYGIGLALLMKSNVKVPKRLANLFLTLGKITYPIYIFQMPVIELIFGIL